MTYHADWIRVRSGHPPEFVRSHSFSHRHHHNHHRRHKCHDDCCGVSWTEYNNLLEQNRNFREQNAALIQERDGIKAELSKAINANRAWSEEAARLSDANGRLSTEIHFLKDEIERLRRAGSSEGDHNKEFKRRIKTLEKELREQDKAFTAEISELRERLRKSNDIGNHWKRMYEDIKRNYTNLQRILFDRDAQIEKRNERIEEQASTIRRLRELLERCRGW